MGSVVVVRPIFALAFVFLFMLAGCTAGNDAATRAIQGVNSGAAFDGASGAIAGVVLSEDQLPVAGAAVDLLDANGEPTITALTDEGGVFFLNFVPPGQHQLRAAKDGYVVATKPVAVMAGQVTEEVILELGVVPSNDPYHTTTIHPVLISGRGYTVPRDCIYLSPSQKTCSGSGGCSDSAPETCETEVHYGHCGVKEDEWGFPWTNYGCDFGPEWETLILELDSVPQTTTTGKGWSITALGPKALRAGCSGNATDCGAAQNDGNPSAFRTVAQAPIYQWIDKPMLIARGLTAPEDQCCDWVWRLFPGSCDIMDCDFPAGNVGIMEEQKATVYWTYFMRRVAPDGWSAVQES